MSTTPRPSFFTFGCMSLGTDLNHLDDHVRVARAAMEAGVWFHTSPTYSSGFSFMVLRMAFDEARHQVPSIIVKIRCPSARLVRFEVEDALRRMGLEHLDAIQLVIMDPQPVTEDLIPGGAVAIECDKLRREGKVRQFCPYVDTVSSVGYLPLVESGLFDGIVAHVNPMGRAVDDAMWDCVQRRGTPVWALRTVASAIGEPAKLEQRKRDKPGDPSIAKAERLVQIAAEAGCGDWTTFCVRYAKSVPGLATTIGGTRDLAHLNQLLTAARDPKPLPADVMAAIEVVQRG